MAGSPEDFIFRDLITVQQDFPFFGRASRMVNGLKIEKKPDGLAGNNAIGLWVVTAQVCEEHFAKFLAQVKGEEKEVDIQLLPGHFGQEILGQTLGALVAAKYPEHFKDVLPSYRVVDGVVYDEPVFPGDLVSACVRHIESGFDNKNNIKRLRAIRGTGVIVFNEKLVSAASDMFVVIHPIELGLGGLERKQRQHLKEVPTDDASFANFDNYFKAGEKAREDFIDWYNRLERIPA